MKTFISSILFIVILTSGCGFNGQILRKKSEGLTPAEKDALYQKLKVTEKNGDFYVDGLSLPQDILVSHYKENGADPDRAWTSDKIWKLGIGGLLVGAGAVAGAFQSSSTSGYFNPGGGLVVIGVPFLISGLMEWDWSNYAETFNSFAWEEISAENSEELPQENHPDFKQSFFLWGVVEGTPGGIYPTAGYYGEDWGARLSAGGGSYGADSAAGAELGLTSRVFSTQRQRLSLLAMGGYQNKKDEGSGGYFGLGLEHIFSRGILELGAIYLPWRGTQGELAFKFQLGLVKWY